MSTLPFNIVLADVREKTARIEASDKLLELLRRHHPSHDYPGVDDVQETKKRMT
jgi:hypothetical protein